MSTFSSSFGRRRFMQGAGAVATAVGSAGLLAACGSSTSGSGSKVALQQWYHQYGETGTEQAAFRYAKAYSPANVTVEWEAGDYSTKLQTALLGNNPPDVFEYWSPGSSWVKQGLVEPLDDLFTDTVKADFGTGALSAFTLNGHIYGVKMINDTQFFYYRKSMLSKAGINPASLTSMAALLDAGKKLTSGNVKGLFLGNDGGIGRYEMSIYSTGGDILANNQIAFNTPEVVTAIEELKSVVKSSAVLTGAPTDFTDPGSFINGLCAIQWCGLWAMPAITKALGDDFGIFPWPASGTNGKPAAPFGGWAEMVAAKGKHVAESKALVKSIWIDNTTEQQDWCLDYGYHVPPRRSAAALASKLQSGPSADAVYILDTYGRANSPLIDSAMYTAISDAVTNIINNNADAASEISKAAATCTTELTSVLS